MMHAMRRFGLAVALVVAGCSGSDPQTSRFKTGAYALAVERADLPSDAIRAPIPLLVSPEDQDAWEKIRENSDRPFSVVPPIAVGTRVLVVEDPDKGEDNPMRQVVVKVEDGEFAGKSGKMMRWSLRPVK